MCDGKATHISFLRSKYFKAKPFQLPKANFIAPTGEYTSPTPVLQFG
jgi:hypothetical protein